MWLFRRRRRNKHKVDATPAKQTQKADTSETTEETEPAAAATTEAAELAATATTEAMDPAGTAPTQNTGTNIPEALEQEAAQEHKKQKTLYTWHRDKHNHVSGQSGEPAGRVTLKNGVVIGEGVPKICVPITGEDREAILAQAKEVALAEPDLAEWRADYYADIRDREKMAGLLLQLQEVLGDIPILFTCRTVREGGRGQLPAEDYRSLLLWAAGRPEISLLDVEGMNPEVNTGILISQIRELGMPVIASYHNFSRTPKKADLELIFQRLEQTGADILKVAVMPKKPKDVMRLMNVTAQMHADLPCPVITMSMGDMGKLSRISGSITGSAVTFGTCGEASAPGQMPVSELKKMLAEF